MPFAWFAMIVLVLIALCASLLGSSLVLKRFSMIGDGLSHVAFGASAIAAVISTLLTNLSKTVEANTDSKVILKIAQAVGRAPMIIIICVVRILQKIFIFER